VPVKTQDIKKLPQLDQEMYGFVVEDESEDESNFEDDDDASHHSNEFRSSRYSRAHTGNLSGNILLQL
jgi:hypothetical protein